jgi:hypothetical protein
LFCFIHFLFLSTTGNPDDDERSSEEQSQGLYPVGTSTSTFPDPDTSELPNSISSWVKSNANKPEGKRKEISPLSGDGPQQSDRMGRKMSKRARKSAEIYQHIP